MKLNCVNCGMEIPTANMDIHTGLAKCDVCDEVFSIHQHLDPHAEQGPFRKPLVNPPEGMEISHEGMDLVMTRRWWSPLYYFLLFFVAIWDGILFVWYVTAFTQDTGLGMKVFPLLHVLFGLGIGYVALLGLFNRTRVTVSSGKVDVWNGPLPARKNFQFSYEELEQLYVVKRESYKKNNVPHYCFDVKAKIKNQGSMQNQNDVIDLIKGMSTYEQARYMEQEIERTFGIRDKTVDEEYHAS